MKVSDTTQIRSTTRLRHFLKAGKGGWSISLPGKPRACEGYVWILTTSRLPNTSRVGKRIWSSRANLLNAESFPRNDYCPCSIRPPLTKRRAIEFAPTSPLTSARGGRKMKVADNALNETAIDGDYHVGIMVRILR